MTVIAGGSRCSSGYFAWHLQRTDKGQTVEIRDVVGLVGDDMRGWFDQIEAMALGGNTTNTFYHFSLNPREGEAFTPEQEEIAVAAALKNLGLEDQPYFLVKHGGKDGRPDHFHCIALRVDLDTGKAISDSHNYDIHMKTAAQLEELFGHEPTERGRGPNGRNPKNYEVQRGKETGIDPKDVTAEVTELWRQADSGQAFAAALEAQGFILCEGRRGLCIVDQAGKEYSLVSRVEGAKTKDINARMAHVDRDALPTVEAAKEIAKERKAERRTRKHEAPQPDALPPEPVPHAPVDPTPGTKQRARFGEFVEEIVGTIKGWFTRKEVPQLTMGELTAKEETTFERLASELAHGAREAAPVAASLGAAVVLTQAERLAEKVLHGKASPAQVPVVSEFERIRGQVKQAWRDVGGDEDALMTAGLEWSARKLGQQPSAAPPPSRELTPFEQIAEDTKAALRANGGQPYTGGEETSFWRRAVAHAASAAERLAGWAKASWRELVQRFTRGPEPGRDEPGLER